MIADVSAPRLRRTVLSTLLLIAVLAVVPVAPVAAQDPGWAVERFEGTTGEEVSTTVARRVWPDTDTVVLARTDEFADALSAAPITALLDAPLLLTDRDAMPRLVWEQIEHFAPRRAVLMGGTAAISEDVVAELRRWGVQTIERIAGPNRFATAAAAMDFVRANGGDGDPFLVRGEGAGHIGGWEDAVAVSQHAASLGAPVLLSRVTDLPDESAAALAADGADTVTIIGGEAAVNQDVSDQLWALVDRVDRLDGVSRYHTSIAVADAAVAAGGVTDNLWLVNGENWQDALVAGTAAAITDGVLLYVNPHVWETSIGRDWVLAALPGADRVNIVGHRDGLPTTIDFELVDRAMPRPAWTPPAGVRISPGDNAQAVVDAHPEGTTFVFTAGEHQLVQVVPRDGDRFTGEEGAVLKGSISLAPNVAQAFQDEAGRWVIPGVTFDPPPPPSTHVEDSDAGMESGREGEAIQTDLFAGRHRLTHTGTVETLTRVGQWHFDVAGDRILLLQDPATLGAIELSVAPWAFQSAAEDVEIDHLTVNRYASQSKAGAIDAHNGLRWFIHHVTVAQSKSAAVRTGSGAVVADSRLVHNGQIGITGGDHRYDETQSPVSILRNEIAFNGEVGYRMGWEAGGAKLTNTIDSVFEQNWSHHNRGAGLWCDLDCADPSWISNLSEHNYAAGILIEETSGALAHSNIVRTNGALAYGDLGSGIWVANSPGVELAWNVFESNRLPIVANHNGIPAGEHGNLEIAELYVHDNDIRIDAYLPGLRVRTNEPQRYYRDDIVWEDNVYRRRADHTEHFWMGRKVTVPEWQDEFGHDRNGRFLDVNVAAFQPPSPFTTVPYGAS